MQVNLLLQNARSKEKQMEKLQMTVKERTGMEVRNVSLPIVQSFAKQKVMVIAKHVVSDMVRKSIGDLELLKQFPQKCPPCIILWKALGIGQEMKYL